MNAQRHLRIATIASIFLFLVLTGLAIFAGTTTSIAARGNTGKALTLQAILATNKKELFDTSPFVPAGRFRNNSDGRSILDPSILTAHVAPSVLPVTGPVQTFDTFAPPTSFAPFTNAAGVTDPRTSNNIEPVWSADESYMLFSSNRTADGSVATDGRYHIWAISANGGQAVQVTTSAAGSGEFFPALNSGNTALAFTSDARSPGVQNLYAINFQPGQGVTNVASLTTSDNSLTLRSDNVPLDFDNVRRPTWGGSGQIAFSARTKIGAYQGHYHIYYLYASTLGFDENPGSNAPPAKLTNGPADDNNPAWAGDGTYIAFDSTASALNANGVISGDFNASPILTSAPSTNSGLHSIYMITNSGAIPSALAASQGRVTIAGTDDVTPAWSSTASNPYSNPRGDTEYLAFSRGGTTTSNHDIFYLRTVSKVLQGGESGPSSESQAQAVPAGTAVYQLNAGGPAVAPYSADDRSTGITVNAGSVGSFPTGATVNTAGVINPAPATAYLTYHTATTAAPNFTYTIPNLGPNSVYTINLHFAEPTATGNNQRVFNISVNGVQQVTNFDIFAVAGGQNIATSLPIFASADANGQIALTFSSVTGSAIVNAIEVISNGSGRSITIPGNPDPRAPTNVSATPIGTIQPEVNVQWTGVANAVAYNIYRSSSAAPGQGFVLLAGGIQATTGNRTNNPNGIFNYVDTNIVAKVTYTYYVTSVFNPQSATIVTSEGVAPLHRVNTETNPTQQGFHNYYPAWSPFSRIFSIVYQSDRSITYTDPTTQIPSQTEISLPDNNQNPPIGSNYSGLLQSEVVNVDPPTLQRFNSQEVVHLNVGANPVMPSTADPTGGATRRIQQGQKVWFTVRLSDRTAGIDNGAGNAHPKVYVQIKDPDSKYQDDQGLEHKVFAQDPRVIEQNRTFGDIGSGSAPNLLFNGYGLGNRPVPYIDQTASQVINNARFYQPGVIGGNDAGVSLALGVNIGPDTWLPPTATDPVKGIVFGGDPNNYAVFGPEYECQYVNPTVAAPNTGVGDYGTPYYLAGYDDRTPFTGSDARGASRPNTEWLELQIADPSLQDHKGGVLYNGYWTVPTNTVSDYYLDVIAYNQAAYPFDDNVNLNTYGQGDWRIYDNVWGMTSKGFGSDNDLMVVSDYMLGQKFAATSFGGDASFISKLLPVFYGAESYVTDIDSSLLPNAGWYWVSENGTVEPYIVPIVPRIPFGIYPQENLLNLTGVRNGLGVNSYLDPTIATSSLTLDHYSNYPSQRYSIWRTLCRGPVTADALKNYLPTKSNQPQPAVVDAGLGLNAPAATVQLAPRAVLWFSPFVGQLLVGPGTIQDNDTQALLKNFVQGGGRLMVSSQGLVSSGLASDFVASTLHVASNPAGGAWQVAAGAGNKLGVANSFIGNDFRYDPKWRTDASLDQLGPNATAYYSGPDGSLQYLLGVIDGVTPTDGGVSDLTFTGTGASGLTYYENPDPTVGSRVVFASFGLEGIGQEVFRVNDGGTAPRNFHLETNNNRSIMLHNIASYLRTGKISGQILKTDGVTGIANALVYAVPVGGQLGVRQVYSATTGSDGGYTIDGVPPGTYTVYAVGVGYQRLSFAPVVVEGDVTSPVTLKLVPIGPVLVTGIVKDSISGLPISGANIAFTSSDNSYTTTATTGANGVYTVSLPTYDGGLTYSAVASKLPDYAAGAPQSIVVTPGQPIDGTVASPSANAQNADFLLTPVAGTITGRVFDKSPNAGNAGIVGATVTVVINGKTAQSTLSGTNGAYTLSAGAGTYTLTATKAGYDSQSISVTVVAKQTTAGNDIGLNPIPPGYIGGTVINLGTGQPVGGLTVKILTPDYKTVITQFTTSATTTSAAAPKGDGAPVNYGGALPEGTYGIHVEDTNLGVAGPTNPTVAATGNFTITRNQFSRINFTFIRGTLGGLVKGGPNSPALSGVTVTVKTLDGTTVATTTTGSITSPAAPAGDGSPVNYQLFVPDGTYNVTFSKNGYVTSAAIQTVLSVGVFTRLDYNFVPVHSFPAGLQMISAPYDYSGFSLDAIFGVNRSKLVIWQPQLLTYVTDPTPPANTLQPGYGYWIKLPAAVDLSLQGAVPSNPVSVAIGLNNQAVWNQIGVPALGPIKVTDLNFVTNRGATISYTDAIGPKYSLISPNIYGYDPASNSYVKVTTLQPWQGYWIKSYDSAKVLIPTTASQ